MARKTIDVQDVTERVNRMISLAPCKETRETLAILLSGILMDTDNYHGFRYLPSEFENGEPKKDFDDSRVEFFQR